MQLIVLKCDGSREVYLHTKVMGAIAAALTDCDCFEPGLSEQLAEAVTTFLKKRYGYGQVTTDEIHSMIEVVLSDVGYEDAALQLHEHRIARQLKRGRITVIHRNDDLQHEACHPTALPTEYVTEPWNKSIIVKKLREKHDLSVGLARAVATAVEEEVMSLARRTLTASLVRELVSNELFVMQQAQAALAADKAVQQIDAPAPVPV